MSLDIEAAFTMQVSDSIVAMIKKSLQVDSIRSTQRSTQANPVYARGLRSGSRRVDSCDSCFLGICMVRAPKASYVKAITSGKAR